MVQAHGARYRGGRYPRARRQWDISRAPRQYFQEQPGEGPAVVDVVGMSEGENEGAYARLRRCVKLLRRLQTLDFDGIVAVTGEKGIGKSTVGLQILRQLHGDYFPERPFRIGEVVAYSNEDVREKLATLPKFGGFMADEAARFAMGEDWMKSDNKELKKLLAQCRKPNNLIGLLNIPQLTWLDNKYISGLVNVWIWVVARGVAVIL